MARVRGPGSSAGSRLLATVGRGAARCCRVALPVEGGVGATGSRRGLALGLASPCSALYVRRPLLSIAAAVDIVLDCRGGVCCA